MRLDHYLAEITLKVPAPFAGVSDLGFSARYRFQSFIGTDVQNSDANARIRFGEPADRSRQEVEYRCRHRSADSCRVPCEMRPRVPGCAGAGPRARLRTGAPAVMGRVRDGRVVLDLRTVFPRQEGSIVHAFQQALNRNHSR